MRFDFFLIAIENLQLLVSRAAGLFDIWAKYKSFISRPDITCYPIAFNQGFIAFSKLFLQ